ncbi:MAG: hypothetical protein JXJ17_05650 [Anaerolineae bacterium]|nr:hypothetical protein [Anaerolineae bacterium]
MTASPQIPEAAWSRRLDKVLESPGRPGNPSFDIILEMLPAIIRINRANKKARKSGRLPLMDPFNTFDPGPYLGVPLGGLGGGTITRGWQGDFSRWQMRPGIYQYETVAADQFSVYVKQPGKKGTAQVLYPGKPVGGALSGWAWELPGSKSTYHALYPRAWTEYNGVAPGLNLTCRQVSPVLPHNYKESSLPAGVFAWTVENTSDTEMKVGLMFTFQNGFGAGSDFEGGHVNSAFSDGGPSGPISGVVMKHNYRQPKPLDEGQVLDEQEYYEDPLSFAIAAQGTDEVKVSYRTRFVTNGSGMDVWHDFRTDGELENVEDEKPSNERIAIGAAVCATVTVPAGGKCEVAFALGWDMPIARFGEGRGWYRRYTRFYGKNGESAPRIVCEALDQYSDWETQIGAWQESILDDPRLPDWYKSALFNEAYYITDGGTVWTDGLAGGDQPDMPEDAAPCAPEPGDYGHFAYLEGHEYRMYNTYDVHFYASFALASLWPELELSLQRDIARALTAEHPEELKMVLSGHRAPRKVRGAIPHDIGGPTEDPWYRVNAYDFQDVSRWKDLNPKFVLQIYRDFVATQDIDFLVEVWDAVVEAIDYARQFDVDEDGLIENEGYPDQTYDTWSVSGPSAYSGGLWLAALAAAAEMADILDQGEAAKSYRDTLAKGQRAYEDLLWTGEYYAYDASRSAQATSIMADQLAGDWYARACGLPGIVSEANAQSALKVVFDHNVRLFESGTMGAVNGMRPDGRVDASTMQSQEVWTGTTYAVAAAMLQLDMSEEAFATAEGIYKQTYEELGYWFCTPEAWTYKGRHRSLAYMRPLAIWAMQWAWDRRG